MSSRNTTPPVLDFIEATRLGKRAQRQKLEMEKQERERDKGWGLDEDRLEGDEKSEAVRE